MQLFKSLICAQGRDNRQRFLAIHLAIYLILLITVQIGAGGLTIMMTLGLTALSGLSSVRRLRDANRPLPWAAGQMLLVAACCLVIAFGEHPSRYLLLLLSTLATFALALPLARQAATYVQGYQGPVSLDATGGPGARDRGYAERIEPTLAMAASELSTAAEPGLSASVPPTRTEAPIDAGPAGSPVKGDDPLAPLLHWLSQHRRLALALAAVFSLAVIIAVLMPMMAKAPDPVVTDNEPPVEESTPAEVVIEHQLAMPDSYWLLLNNHQGLILQWQADETEQKQMWSQATAEGDLSCQSITFNNGDKIRTLDVTVEDGIDYLARFSPLDTALIIEGLAMRGSFKLCGYDFSLKGSQRALNSDPAFAGFLD